MDPFANPYSPGAGTPPPALTGRDPELEQYRLLLGRLQRGRPEQSLLITGLRGVGKTVLLEAFEGIALADGWFAASTEITSDTRLPKLVATLAREALIDLSRVERAKDRARRALGVVRGFTIGTSAGVDLSFDVDAVQGVADSGDLGRDVGDLLIEVGEAATAAGKGVVFLLDEVQFISKRELEALITAMQRASRKRVPVAIVGAGLPLIPKLAGEARSYAERLFVFPRIGALDDAAAREALAGPAAEEGVAYDDAALEAILDHSGRYPYFIQLYGKHSWLEGRGDRITEQAVDAAHGRVQRILDKDFFHVRIERTTELERRYLRAMAELGDDRVASGEVTRTLGYESTTETGPLRDSLIKKGLIYSPSWNALEFTVPMFGDYMRRNFPLEVAQE
jgi:AAA ATPase-like protein